MASVEHLAIAHLLVKSWLGWQTWISVCVLRGAAVCQQSPRREAQAPDDTYRNRCRCWDGKGIHRRQIVSPSVNSRNADSAIFPVLKFLGDPYP